MCIYLHKCDNKNSIMRIFIYDSDPQHQDFSVSAINPLDLSNSSSSICNCYWLKDTVLI